MTKKISRQEAERYFGEKIDEYFELHPSILENTEEIWEISFINWLLEMRAELNDDGT